MRNKAIEALLTIILSGALLAGTSFFITLPEIPLFKGNVLTLSFIDKNRLFDFSPAERSLSADSLIMAYSTDTLITPEDTRVVEDQIALLPADSLSIIDAVNKKLNRLLVKDTAGNNETVRKFISRYLTEEGNDKKRIIKEELFNFLNIQNIVNEFLLNPEKDGRKALDKFFAYLMQHKDSGIVRIIHYGDSQLEGDRVTSSLRNKMHARFGGSGLGYVPLIDIADHLNLSRSHSLNWRRHTIFQNKYHNSYYGPAGVVFRFGYKVSHEPEEAQAGDSNGENLVPPKKSDSLVTYSDRAYVDFNLRPHVQYKHAYLMYGRSSQPCKVNIYSGGTLLSSAVLPESNTFEIFELDLPENTRHFKLEFIASVSPDFYGLLLDGEKGVQIDNYALRGHSGDGLLLLNPGYYALQMKALNVRLIILQYGTNAVPYVRSEKTCAWLEETFVSVISSLKNAAPDASVMFIGVGDMARRSEGGISSYPMLPKIRDAEKNAALRTHCAYWDLYESMGGANSILTWMKQNLAVMDGHLSPKGREIMANEIFGALMTEYDLYRYKQHDK